VNFVALDHEWKTDGYTDLQIISGKRNFNLIYIQNNRECEETKLIHVPLILFIFFFRWTMVTPLHDRDPSRAGEYPNYITMVQFK
jgi:hypothetical protein